MTWFTQLPAILKLRFVISLALAGTFAVGLLTMPGRIGTLIGALELAVVVLIPLFWTLYFVNQRRQRQA